MRKLHRGPRPAENGDGGFTLIEMMVALFVIAVVTAGFLALTISTLRAASWHEDRTRANQVAQNSLESVVAQPWSTIGLYASDTGYLATANGSEPTVTLTASPRKPSVPLPVATKTVSGVDYSVRTNITWRDDASDGTGGSDANGDTHDIKHVAVSVTWTVGQHSGVVTMDGLRSPTATEVAPNSGAMTVTVSGPVSQQLSAAGNLATAMTITATTSKSATTASLRFGTRNGAQSVAMTNVGGGTSWSVTLPTTTGPFDTGPTNFTVVATTSTTSGTGSTSVQLTIGASTSTVTVKATPSQTLSATGTLSNAISVTATGSSAITSGSVTYATHAGSATRFLAGSGNNWSVTLPADATVYDPGTESFSVAVVFSDGSTGTGLASISLFSSSLPPDVTALIANSPFTAGGTTQGFCVDNTSFNLFTATTVDATVSNVATTDTVRLTAPGLTTAEFVMSYLKTNADGSMVFRYSVPSGTPFPNATSIVLKAYALKTISGTQYRDDFVTSPGIPIQAFKKSSSCL